MLRFFLINPRKLFHYNHAFTKKLNTYGVESPCECLPGVGSFLANPGLSKEQLVPSCVVRIFIMVDISIEVLALNIWRCIITTFIMADVFIDILALHLWRCAL